MSYTPRMRILLNRDRAGCHLHLKGVEKNYILKLWTRVLFPGVYQNGCPLQCWLERGMVLSDIVLNWGRLTRLPLRYPLPKISECIDGLAGCENFSCLDMANGYYQIKMVTSNYILFNCHEFIQSLLWMRKKQALPRFSPSLHHTLSLFIKTWDMTMSRSSCRDNLDAYLCNFSHENIKIVFI